MVIKRTSSQCKSCPLDGQRKVCGRTELQEPSLIFVGEAPGRDEDKQGKPFVGKAGHLLRKLIDRVQGDERTTHFMNVINCRPPNNEIDSHEGIVARKRCEPGFFQELDLVTEYTKVVVPLGNTALSKFAIRDTITKARGSVYIRYLKDGKISDTETKGSKELYVVPSYHPSYIARTGFKEESTWANDIQKAYRLSNTGYKVERERFNLHPTLNDVEKFVQDATKKQRLVALDIETAYSLDPNKSEIVCVGLAVTNSSGICIPFFSKGMTKYWTSSGEEEQVKDLLRELFSSCPVVIQNAFFDIRHLEAHGIPIPKLEHDILLLHHAIHPELPHNLGYIVSIYGTTPYWKGEVLGKSSSIQTLDDKTLRTYNLRDTVVLLQVLDRMLVDLKDSGTEEIYFEYAMKLVRPLITVMDNGIGLNKRRLAVTRRLLEKKAAEYLQTLREIAHLPDSFNFGSGDDMRFLLYGVEPNKAKRLRAEWKQYEENMRLRRDTKKFKKLCEDMALLEITPLYKTKATISKTDGGQLQVDEQNLLRIDVAATNRLNKIENLTQRQPRHDEEEARILQLREFLKVFRQYVNTNKLLTTYMDFPVSTDDRVHTQYIVHGTATGRLASRKPNLQNVPKHVDGLPEEFQIRSAFIPDPGKVFVQADYSNLELRIIAYISDDDALRHVFENGLNAHDENTKALFEIDEDHPKWKEARNAAKTYIFGRNYGGGLRGIYEKVMMKAPDMDLTFKQFEQADQRYRRAHPKYAKWYDETSKRVLKTRMLRNAFGRLRIFTGADYAVLKEGLNFPIQSTAADIVNKVIIELHKKLPKTYKMIGTVHDSIMLEVPKRSTRKACMLLRETMEQPFNINGTQAVFPVDIETGQDWYNMKKVDVDAEAQTVR